MKVCRTSSTGGAVADTEGEKEEDEERRVWSLKGPFLWLGKRLAGDIFALAEYILLRR